MHVPDTKELECQAIMGFVCACGGRAWLSDSSTGVEDAGDCISIFSNAFGGCFISLPFLSGIA